MLLDHAIALLRVVLVLSVWRAVIGPGEEAGGLTGASVLTHVLGAQVFTEQLDARSPLLDNIWNGQEMSRQQRATVIVTSHDMSDLEQLAQRIVMIDHGRKSVSTRRRILAGPARSTSKICLKRGS